MRIVLAALRWLARWEGVLLVLLILALVVSGSISPFFREQNFFDLIKSFVAIGLMSLGLTFVIIAGEIDISITSTLALSTVIFATAWSSGVDLALSALLAVLVGAVLGLFNGVLVALFNLPALAVTLGTLAAYRGLAYVILTTQGVTGFPDAFTRIGFGYVGDTKIPVAVVVLAVFTVIFSLILHFTRFGRQLYILGSNREVARFSGVRVRFMRLSTFVISGVMAAIAGLIYAGFFNTVRADVASEDLLDVITAVVLGGVDIFGGSGSIPGVLLALILIAVMRKGMALANISSPVQGMIIGVLLLVAILLGNFLRQRVQQGTGGHRDQTGVADASSEPATT